MDIIKSIVSGSIEIGMFLTFGVPAIIFGFVVIKVGLEEGSWFSFSGRLARKRFAINTLIAIAALIICSLLTYFTIKFNSSVLLIITIFSFLCSILFYWSNIVRRLHDLNHPGKFAFILFITTSLEKISDFWLFVDIVILLYLLFKKGTLGANKYGEASIKNSDKGNLFLTEYIAFKNANPQYTTTFSLIDKDIMNLFKNDKFINNALHQQHLGIPDAVLLAITNISSMYIASGKYHTYRGILSMQGTDLHHLFSCAVDKLHDNGFYSEEDALKEKSWISAEIKDMG